MVSADNERSLALARRGVAGVCVAGLAVVAVSMWTLLGAGTEPSPTDGVAIEPIEVAVPVAPARALEPLQQASVATMGDLNRVPIPNLDWAPELAAGASVVDFSVTNVIADGGKETFRVADSFSGTRGVRGGERHLYKVREGELVLIQQTPSGWPDPKIVCNGGDPLASGSAAFLTLNIGPGVDCTITNTRDSDSLSVIDTRFTCDGIVAEVRGPTPPFFVSYTAVVDGDASGRSTGLGSFRVEEAGEFVIPFDLLERPSYGIYRVSVVTEDFFGGRVVLTDTASVHVSDSGFDTGTETCP